MKGTFDHIIYTHIGEYRTFKSRGVSTDLVRGIMLKKPDFDTYPERYWLFQQNIDDNIVIGYLEKATDQSRPFVHCHLVLVKFDDYIKLNLHPQCFQEHFITYNNCIQRASEEELEPLEIPVILYPVNKDMVEKYADEKRLIAILDSMIEATEGKHRIKLDFKNMGEAIDFLYTMLALIPSQLRAAASFLIGAEPKNLGFYNMVLRIAPLVSLPELAIKPSSESYYLSKSIAGTLFSVGEVSEIHTRFSKLWDYWRHQYSDYKRLLAAVLVLPLDEQHIQSYESKVDREETKGEQHIQPYESKVSREETEGEENPVDRCIAGGRLDELFKRFRDEEIAQGLDRYLKTRDKAKIQRASSIVKEKPGFESWLRSKKDKYLQVYEIILLNEIESMSLDSLRANPHIIDEIVDGLSFLSSLSKPLVEMENALYKKIQELLTKFDLKNETKIFLSSQRSSSPIRVPPPALILELLIKLVDQIDRKKTMALLESYTKTLSLGIGNITKTQTTAVSLRKSYKLDSPIEAAQILGTFYSYLYPRLFELRSRLRGGSIPREVFDNFREILDHCHTGLLDALRKSSTVEKD